MAAVSGSMDHVHKTANESESKCIFRYHFSFPSVNHGKQCENAGVDADLFSVFLNENEGFRRLISVDEPWVNDS